MSQLTNTAISNGNYNSIPTTLTSSTSIVNLIEGLSISIESDKKNWIDGFLTYTITIENQTELPYENSVITDELDTSLIEFVEDSVTINDIKATPTQYEYNTNTLTINLGTVEAHQTGIAKFSVKKKYNGSFILKNIAKIYSNKKLIQKSNITTTLIRPEKYFKNSLGCNTPFWR